MPISTRPQPHAFRDLERALTRRRLMRLDPRMRGEFALLALLIAGFLFWQVRVPLDGLVRAGGPVSGAGGCAVLFSSHVTETIERLCDRAALLHGGRVARIIERSACGGPPSGPSPLEREFLVVAGPSTR
jgi:hypothetical protein